MKYDFSWWSTEDLVDLLDKSGYGSSDIISSYYKQTDSNGTVIFNIDYETLEGDIESSNVYVSIRNGKLVAEY